MFTELTYKGPPSGVKVDILLDSKIFDSARKEPAKTMPQRRVQSLWPSRIGKPFGS